MRGSSARMPLTSPDRPAPEPTDHILHGVTNQSEARQRGLGRRVEGVGANADLRALLVAQFAAQRGEIVGAVVELAHSPSMPLLEAVLDEVDQRHVIEAPCPKGSEWRLNREHAEHYWRCGHQGTFSRIPPDPAPVLTVWV